MPMTRVEANKLIDQYHEALAAAEPNNLIQYDKHVIQFVIDRIKELREEIIIAMGAPAWKE